MLAVALICLASCGTTMRYVTPEYTTTGDIFKLNPGMTEAKVIQTLGIQPYEIQFNLNEESKILTWYYRKPHHELKKPKADTELVLSTQTPKYREEGILHVYFSNGVMTNFYTGSGADDSRSLLKEKHELSRVAD